MKDITAGFALCGSFCTFSKAIEQIEYLVKNGVKVIPIMSGTAYSTDTRFGKATDFISKIEDICGNKILSTLTEVEPIGPKKILDILIIEPCTGNTIGKLANGITDSSVTLAAKAHLRNHRPVLIGVSTNDALGASAANIGKLFNNKYIYFIPMHQDDPIKKPNSIVADFTKTYDSMLAALEFKQIQPVMI
jgi:dipicolinate synthase subunit B